MCMCLDSNIILIFCIFLIHCFMDGISSSRIICPSSIMTFKKRRVLRNITVMIRQKFENIIVRKKKF
jgi:hypothetical protein